MDATPVHGTLRMDFGRQVYRPCGTARARFSPDLLREVCMKAIIRLSLAVLLLLPAYQNAMAQIAAPNPTLNQSLQVQQPTSQNPLYRISINVVERQVQAVNFQHRGGATKVYFRGTALLPDSHGEAKVESKQGYIEIEVEFD